MRKGDLRRSVLRLAREAPVWAFVGALATGAVLFSALGDHGSGRMAVPLHLAWPILAAGFAAGHLASIQIELFDQNHRVDLTDVVMLPAVVFLSPTQVVLAAALGTFVTWSWDHAPVVKAAFNVALHAFAAAVAVFVFDAVLGHASPVGPAGWLGGFAAVAACEVATVACIQIVIGLASRQFSASNLPQVAIALAYVVAADATLGLAAVHLLWGGLAGGAIFLAVATVVGIEYATHGRLRRRHTTLEHVYRFERALAGMVETERVIAAVLGEALELFNAGVAQLVTFDASGTTCHTLRSGDARSATSHDAHALAVLAGRRGGALVAPRGSRDPDAVLALQRSGFRDAIALRLPADVATSIEFLVVADRLGGELVTFEEQDLTLAETLATPTAMALRSSDLLAQLRAEVSIKEHQASHDALTGLANRTLYSAEVDRALLERRPGSLVGLMLIDLDGFKSLNDTLGHGAGDVFLQALATVLADVVGERGTVGRLGGDEFAVVMPDVRDLDDVGAVAAEINRSVRAPVDIAGTTVDLRASIGVSVAPMHGEDRFTLLREADLAMYRAKQEGGGVAFHDDRYSGQIDRPSLIAALREAISTSSLVLNYQPKVDLVTGELAGVEALVRWTHPRYGAISPETFIPVAESSGLIRPLTRWILATALDQYRAWREVGLDVSVAINISPVQLNDPEIARHVGELIARYEMRPGALTLEITESSVLSAVADDADHVLEPLARTGVRLSIDDFGVGTSSLARLKRLPVSEVKVDKLFITSLVTDPTNDAIVESTIKLAHHLGLVVVAEGVENHTTYRRLRVLGCDVAQGYLFSAPLAPDELARWARRRDEYAPRQTAAS